MRLDQDDVAKTFQRVEGEVDHVRHAVDRIAARAASDARVGALRHHLAAGLAGDLLRQRQPVLAQRAVRHQDQRRLAALEDFRSGVDRRGGHRRALRDGADFGDAVRVVPGGVCGEDQRRDLTRRGACRGDGGRTIARDRLRIRRRAHPGRDRPRQSLDVGGERRVVIDVIGRVLADDVDDAGRGLLGVVQVGDAVAETGTEMQQRRGRRALHAVVAVGGAGHHAFEQAEHAAHAVDAIERGNEVHFRSARVGETHVHLARDQRSHQTFRTVHGCTVAFVVVEMLPITKKSSFASRVKRFARMAQSRQFMAFRRRDRERGGYKARRHARAP